MTTTPVTCAVPAPSACWPTPSTPSTSPTLPGPEGPADPGPDRRGVRQRLSPTLHVHLHLDAIQRNDNRAGHLGRVDTAGRQLGARTRAVIERWIAGLTPSTTLKLTPVVDLTEHISVDSYEIPPSLRSQVAERDHRRNLGSHATPWLVVDLASMSSSISAGVRKSCRLRGLELSSAAMLSSMPEP